MDASPFARVPGFRTPAPTPRHLIGTLNMMKPPATIATWTSPERLYLTEQGAVVKHGDPAAATLLVAAGGQIPLDQALGLGLAETSAPVVNAAPAIDVPNVPAGGVAVVGGADALATLAAIRAQLGLPEGADVLVALQELGEDDAETQKGWDDLVTERDGLRDQVATLTGRVKTAEGNAVGLQTQLTAAQARITALSTTPPSVTSPVATGNVATPTGTVAPAFDIPGITRASRDALVAANLWSDGALRRASDAELAAVPNIGEGTIARIRLAQGTQGG